MQSRLFRRSLVIGCAALAAGALFLVSRELPATMGRDDEAFEALVPTPAASTGSCGVERWSVKTGTDADIGLVNLGSVTPNTITTLAGWPAPSTIPANNRVSPYETTVWQLNGTLAQFKLESDSDYHLVMADGSGRTLIVEIPDPACVATTSPLRPKIVNARAQFDAKYTATTSFQSANIPVVVTGVGMFDFLHGQTGVAPNGIELHAVLDINFNPGATHAISGTVTNASGAAVAGVTVAAGSASATTSATGAYTLGGLASGSYTVTPGSSSYTFSPANRAVTVSGADVSGQNFTATPVVSSTYAISGAITSGGAGLAGATVSFSGPASGSATTDGNGNYSVTGLAAGTYALSPAKSGYSFTPASASVTVGPSATRNFTASATPGGATALSNGVGVNSSVNGAAADADWKDFTIAVPAGATNLTIATTGATADVDLYVKFGAAPSLTAYDCRPYTASGNESCSFATPSAGIYQLRVYNYATGAISFTVTASYTAGGGTRVERLGNGGFESGSNGAWVLPSSNTAGSAGITTTGSYPHAGTSYGYLGNQVNNAAYEMYQAVAIPAGATAGSASFWIAINTNESSTATTAYDTMTAALKSATGATLCTLGTYSNVNWTGSTPTTAGVYVYKSFTLTPACVTAIKGKTVRLDFAGASDVSNGTTFRLDDISLKTDG